MYHVVLESTCTCTCIYMYVHCTCMLCSLHHFLLGCPSTYAYLSARMILNGMWCGINSQTTAVRMCPPLTTKNWAYYVPQLAVGTAAGVVYVVSLYAEAVVQEISIHTCPVRLEFLIISLSLSLSHTHTLSLSLSLSLTHTHTHTLTPSPSPYPLYLPLSLSRGIEWLSQHTFVSWASTAVSSPTPLRNEVCVTDINTGRVTPLSREDSESGNQVPIEAIRVSSHKSVREHALCTACTALCRNYLVAKYKDRPLEFWDAKTLTFMRELVSNPPTFSCVVSMSLSLH